MNFKYASYTVLIFLITLLSLSTVSAVDDTNVTDNYQLPINDTNPVTGETSGRYLINISEEVEYSDDVVITVNINDTRFPDYPVDYPNDYLEFLLTDSQGNEWYNRIYNITNGTGIVPIYNNPNLTVGTYGVYCYYFDGYDWIGELTTNVTILKGNPILNIDVNDIWYGEIANIKVNINQFNATGNITITVNGKNYTSNIINRTSSFSISDLDAGKYTIDAIYNGNEKYNVAKANTTFNVNKFDSSVNVTVDDIFVGDDAVIVADFGVDISGNVTFVVDGVSYVAVIEDGVAKVNVPGLSSGNYVVSVIFQGNEKYNPCNGTATFNVAKLNSSVIVTVDDIFVGDDAVIVADFGVDISGNVTFVVDGVSYVAVIEDGVAKVNVPGLSSGSYVVSVIFQGNEKYNPTNGTSVFNVTKLNSSVIVSADDIFVGDDATIIVKVSDDATGIVTITVNNNQYNVTFDNGTGILKLSNLTSGEYNVSAKYLGDDKYLPSENTTTFKVNKLDTPISVVIDNKTDVVIIKVIVPNDTTGNITITVDGKNYTSEIINGTATIKISGLNEGNYNITIYYDGDDKYLANSTNSSFVIQFNHDDNKTDDTNKTDVDDNTSIDLNNDNVIDSENSIAATDNTNKSTNLNLNTGNPLLILLMALIMLIPLRKRK